jgi:hypothetical protein
MRCHVGAVGLSCGGAAETMLGLAQSDAQAKRKITLGGMGFRPPSAYCVTVLRNRAGGKGCLIRQPPRCAWV